MVDRGGQSVVELLAYAASEVIPAPDREPWDYGWSVPEYRRSGQAAISGPDGAVTLSDGGLGAWEVAAERLARESQIQIRWEPGEFWGILASLVVAASKDDDILKGVTRRVEIMRSAGPALIVVLIANVTWGRAPLRFEDLVVGNADESFVMAVDAARRERPGINAETAQSWLSGYAGRPDDVDSKPVAIACWTLGQGRLASAFAERTLQNLVDLCILLERDLKSRRDPTNRPGVRGLTLDRGALEKGLTQSAHVELYAQPLIITDVFRNAQSVQWHGSEPLPLGQLLDQDFLRVAVRSCFHDDPISKRLRIAARWFAEAQYTTADDSALALGVAMDSLLGGQRALPGSALADRFALLTTDPDERRSKVKSYLEYYRVRSSVAHGGRSSMLDRDGFLTEYLAAVHWAAWRMIALRDTFAPSSEQEIDALFDELRWGAKVWPKSGNGELN